MKSLAKVLGPGARRTSGGEPGGTTHSDQVGCGAVADVVSELVDLVTGVLSLAGRIRSTSASVASLMICAVRMRPEVSSIWTGTTMTVASSSPLPSTTTTTSSA